MRYLCAVLIAIVLCSLTATAAPVRFTFVSKTGGYIPQSPIPGTVTGDDVILTVLADNGGTSIVSQKWSPNQLLGAELIIGPYKANFTGVLSGFLSHAFETDSTGALSLVAFRGNFPGLGDSSDNFGPNVYLQDGAVTASNRTYQHWLGGYYLLERWSGPVFIPEPSGFTLLCLGSICLLRRK